MPQRLQFIGSVAVLYIITIGTIGGLLYSSHLFGTPVWAAQPTPALVQPQPPLPKSVVSGKPVRITLPDSSIDLPLNDGTYDPSDGSWTLSDSAAQYATLSAPANDHAGTTFIYGHGTDAVFGKIGTTHPAIGSMAFIVTDNNHTFTYQLQEIKDFTPSDTSIFDSMTSGPPRMIVQTCTGVFSEWRTMFMYSLKEVS